MRTDEAMTIEDLHAALLAKVERAEAAFENQSIVARDLRAKIESDAKVIAALREALEELRVLGEQGAPPDYTRWLAFHDRVAEIARNGLGAVEQTVAKDDKDELRSSRLRRWEGL